MKKNLFFLAVAAVAFAACSNDETVAVNESQGEAISFRPFVSGVTRAVDADLSTAGTSFYVTALKKDQTLSSANTYFEDVQFTKEGANFVSANKYYWPSDYNLDFYAYAPAAATGTDVVRTDYKTFSITANTDVTKQKDFVYADTKDWGKITSPSGNDGKNGVTINFRHAESKVVVQLKNSNSNLKFTVGNVTFGNLYGAGTFTHNLTTTDGNNSSNLTNAEWETSGTRTVGYTQSGSSLTISSTAQQVGDDMILIPQTLTAATSYASAGVGDAFNGAYISVQLKIQNVSNNAYIVGGESTFVEAIWPVQAITWVPGYKYIYTVDLAGGGYFPTSQDADSDLDPVLSGAEIMFATVTLDAWDEHEDFIGNLTYAKGSTYTYNVANKAAGQYSITITGLTTGSTVSATGTNNFASPTVTPTTVGASGSVTITGVLTANTSAAVTSVITLTESGSGTSTTTINIVQAAE